MVEFDTSLGSVDEYTMKIESSSLKPEVVLHKSNLEDRMHIILLITKLKLRFGQNKIQVS